MTRKTHTPQTLQGSKPSAYDVANIADITYAVTNGAPGDGGDQFVCSGNDIIIARNDQAGAQTITIYSAEDPYGLVDDITTYSIGIGEYAIIGPLKVIPWRQADGNMWFATSHADILVAVIAL